MDFRYVDTIELRKAMAEARINSIIALSEATGVNRNTLSDILNDKIRPSGTVIEKIAKALSLDAESIGRIFFTYGLAEVQGGAYGQTYLHSK